VIIVIVRLLFILLTIIINSSRRLSRSRLSYSRLTYSRLTYPRLFLLTKSSRKSILIFFLIPNYPIILVEYGDYIVNTKFLLGLFYLLS